MSEANKLSQLGAAKIVVQLVKRNPTHFVGSTGQAVIVCVPGYRGGIVLEITLFHQIKYNMMKHVPLNNV